MRQLSPIACSVIAGFLSAAFLFISPNPLFAAVLGLFAYSLIFAVFWMHGSKYGALAYGEMALLSLLLGGPLFVVVNAVSIGIPLLIAGTLLTQPMKDGAFFPGGLVISRLASFFLAVILGMGALFAQRTQEPLSWFLGMFENLGVQLSDPHVLASVLVMLPGFFAVSVMVTLAINAAIGYKVAAQLSKAGFAKELVREPFGEPDVVFPRWWDIVAVFGVLLSMTDVPLLSFIGQNGALIAAVPLYCLGLSVASAVIERRWLLGLLVTVSLMLPHIGLVVVLVGVLESALGIRARFGKS